MRKAMKIVLLAGWFFLAGKGKDVVYGSFSVVGPFATRVQCEQKATEIQSAGQRAGRIDVLLSCWSDSATEDALGEKKVDQPTK